MDEQRAPSLAVCSLSQCAMSSTDQDNGAYAFPCGKAKSQGDTYASVFAAARTVRTEGVPERWSVQPSRLTNCAAFVVEILGRVVVGPR